MKSESAEAVVVMSAVSGPARTQRTESGAQADELSLLALYIGFVDADPDAKLYMFGRGA